MSCDLLYQFFLSFPHGKLTSLSDSDERASLLEKLSLWVVKYNDTITTTQKSLVRTGNYPNRSSSNSG
jgi:hypothetical protein